METKTLGAIVISFIIIGIILGIGFIVFQSFEAQQGTYSATINNETMAKATAKAGGYVVYNYSRSGLYCYNDFSVIRVTPSNLTNITLASGNYTYSNVGWFQTKAGSEYENYSMNITYSYKFGNSSACEGIRTTREALTTIPTWFATIILILVVGVLLYLVMKYLPMAGKGSSVDGMSAEI